MLAPHNSYPKEPNCASFWKACGESNSLRKCSCWHHRPPPSPSHRRDYFTYPFNISQPKYPLVKYFWGLHLKKETIFSNLWTGLFFLYVKINHLLVQLFLITSLPRLSTWGVSYQHPAQSSTAARILAGSSSTPLQLRGEPRTCPPGCLWVLLPGHLLVVPLPPPEPPRPPAPCAPPCSPAAGLRSRETQHASRRLRELLAAGVLPSLRGAVSCSSKLLAISEVSLVCFSFRQTCPALRGRTQASGWLP